MRPWRSSAIIRRSARHEPRWSVRA
jgi:hypothetical protein